MTPGYKYHDHLQSERLFTRFLTLEDVLPWSDFFKDKEATAFFPDSHLHTNEEKARDWIDRQLKRYHENRFGLQALINKETNEFIGQCGLLEQHIGDKSEIEVGYHILKKFWGQGYATEAAKLFIDYAFTNNITGSIVSIIDIRNSRSQKVAMKNGLERRQQTMWSGMEVYVYRIDREKGK